MVEIVDAKATPWSSWGPCSKTCIGDDLSFGKKERTMTPTRAKNGGKDYRARRGEREETDGTVRETANCASPPGSDKWGFCKAKPGDWSHWGACSKSCETGTKERYRDCKGLKCPHLMERKDCTELAKCPVPSTYGQWGNWICSSKCFDPLARGGTSQIRKRTCRDDTPVAHSEQNCDNMNHRNETIYPCNQEPLGFVTYKNKKCEKTSPCGYHGETYRWCSIEGGSWDYCSPDRYTTINGKTCSDGCEQRGQNYFWCKIAGDSWDYCSPRC